MNRKNWISFALFESNLIKSIISSNEYYLSLPYDIGIRIMEVKVISYTYFYTFYSLFIKQKKKLQSFFNPINFQLFYFELVTKILRVSTLFQNISANFTALKNYLFIFIHYITFDVIFNFKKQRCAIMIF